MTDEIEVMHTGERQEACKTVEGELCLLHTAAPLFVQAAIYAIEAIQHSNCDSKAADNLKAALKSAGVEI